MEVAVSNKSLLTLQRNLRGDQQKSRKCKMVL
nr:MAG TPA: hypothetical protein [Herelleviridae sp.]